MVFQVSKQLKTVLEGFKRYELRDACPEIFCSLVLSCTGVISHLNSTKPLVAGPKISGAEREVFQHMVSEPRHSI